MLITSVVVYLLVTIGIGLLAARRVHSAKDYLVAGRSLPLYMNMATVFASADAKPDAPPASWPCQLRG